MNTYVSERDELLHLTYMIKQTEDTNFRNMDFSNEDFKVISHMKGFTISDNGLGFYIKAILNKPLIQTAKAKEKYQSELIELQGYVKELIRWFESKDIIPSNRDGCNVCGYDEFQILEPHSYGHATDMIKLDENGNYDENTYIEMEYCKRCRTLRIKERHRN